MHGSLDVAGGVVVSVVSHLEACEVRSLWLGTCAHLRYVEAYEVRSLVACRGSRACSWSYYLERFVGAVGVALWGAMRNTASETAHSVSR